MVISPNSDCAKSMDLILAIDLMGGSVVWGTGGLRDHYRPLTWGVASSASPVPFVREVSPRFLYVADLDRIVGRGSHDQEIKAVARLVDRCFVDRGCRTPGDYLEFPGIENVVGTETGGEDLSRFHGGFLSIDIRDGKVVPRGEDPVSLVKSAEAWDFDGCIILNLGSVGTKSGIDPSLLEEFRASCTGSLLYGGGIASEEDVYHLAETGFDGAILATAVHTKRLPLSWIRSGAPC